MGRRGPPPTPTKLRLVKGNPGRRPLPRDEPEPRLGEPDKPDFLDERASEVWDEVVGELTRVGLLSRIDGGALAAYCVAFSRWARAEEVLRRIARNDPATGGLVVIMAGRDTPGRNPLLGVASNAMREMMRAAQEFGMTPSARARIAAERMGGKPRGQDDDPAEAFFRNRA